MLTTNLNKAYDSVFDPRSCYDQSELIIQLSPL